MKAVFQNKVLTASLALTSLLTTAACAATQPNQRPVSNLSSEAKEAFETPQADEQLFKPLDKGCYEASRTPETKDGVTIPPQVICPQISQ